MDRKASDIKVSFIVPIYGVEQYLHTCLDSIAAQTLADLEAILIDDGSPDKSGSICDEYAAQDDRFIVIHQANAGVAVARNAGIKLARGRYAYIIDPDDWLESDAAERLYGAAELDHADCVMSSCERWSPDGSVKRSAAFSQGFSATVPEEIGEIQKYVLYQPYSRYYTPETVNGYAAPWGKFVRLDIIQQNGILFDPVLRGVFDDGLWSLRLLDHVKRFIYLHEKTYNYRVLNDSLTHKLDLRAMEIQEAGYLKIEQWLRETGKDRTFWEAYFAHVVAFFGGYLARYFYHPDNPKDAHEVRREIRSMLARDPYWSAAHGVQYGRLKTKDKFLAFCERHRWVAGLRLYLAARNMRPR